MLKPTELAQHDIDEWEGLSESERAVLVAAIPEAGDHPRLCRALLHLRERIGKVIYDLDRGSFETRRIADQLRSDLEVSDDV